MPLSSTPPSPSFSTFLHALYRSVLSCHGPKATARAESRRGPIISLAGHEHEHAHSSSCILLLRVTQSLSVLRDPNMLPPFDYFEHRSAWYVRLTVATLTLSIASYLSLYYNTIHALRVNASHKATNQCHSMHILTLSTS